MPKIKYIKVRFKPETRAILEHITEVIDRYQEADFKLSLRQLYYRLVAMDLIPNTLRSYERIGDIVSKARRAGIVDWDAIEDRHRGLKGRTQWESPADVILTYSTWYHVDLWKDQDYRPEVWVEKDALSGVVERSCAPWDVDHMSCKGYMSDSEMWVAARRFLSYIDEGQTPVLIHLGDHDPSGIDMTRDIFDRLELFCRGQIEVRRIALNMDQIERFNPPPNPAKVTDSRFRKYQEEFGDHSWELDALDPEVLDSLINSTVSDYLNVPLWERQVALEKEGQKEMKWIAQNYDRVMELRNP
jgi:hypothetical protein